MYSFIASSAQVALHLHEAGLRVALVGDEEQPRVEPAQAVGAVDEAVAAAQDRRPGVGRVGQEDVRRRRDGGLAVDLLGEVDRVELLGAGPAARRRPWSRPMVCSCSSSEAVSQGSISIRIRRVTR